MELREDKSHPDQNQQGRAAKPPRIPDQKIAFVQHAFAAGAADKLDERLRLLLAHAVTKPHLTLQELAPFAGVHTGTRISQLWNTGLRALWQASPLELQQRYPLELLRRHRSVGVPFSSEHRAQTIEARKGKPLTEPVASFQERSVRSPGLGWRSRASDEADAVRKKCGIM